MKQVMIVDDEPAIAQAVAHILLEKGYAVTTVGNGRACLEELRKGFRGVILMDIDMPTLDGWATIRAIRAEPAPPQVLICMLTAKTAPGPESAGLEGSVFDYLPKPFAPQALLQMVQNASELLDG